MADPVPTLAPVEVRGLRRRLGPTTAVAGIDLRLEAGARCALLGEPGAGKTTLLRLLCGFLPADEGTARILGREAWVDPEVRREVAILGADPAPPAWLSVREAFRRHAETFPSWHAERDALLEGVLPVDRDRRVGALAPGERRRLGLRLALAQGADLLLLDDPLADADERERERRLGALGAVGDERTTLLFSAESTAGLAERVTHVAILSRGRLLELGRPADLVREVRELSMPITAYNRAAVAIRQAGVVAVRTDRLTRVVAVRRWSEDFHAAVARATGGEFEHRALDLAEVFAAFVDLASTGTGDAP